MTKTPKPTEQDWLDGVAEIVFDYCVNTPESEHPEVFGNTEAATTKIIQLIRTKLEAGLPKEKDLTSVIGDNDSWNGIESVNKTLGYNAALADCKATLNRVLGEL